MKIGIGNITKIIMVYYNHTIIKCKKENAINFLPCSSKRVGEARVNITSTKPINISTLSPI